MKQSKVHPFDTAIACVLDWFFVHQRALPWRGERDPYKIWISEVMLQQTRVETVIPYYHRWIHRFPTVASLSTASIDEVMKLWEGLGYYHRARSLHQGAKQIMESGGSLSPELLRTIPGIGPYTEAAILNLAFRIPTPALDGNVMRVLARYWKIDRPIDLTSTRQELAARLAGPVAGVMGWQLSEALIELGALVCLPKRPQCDVCPLQTTCRARDGGEIERYPLKRARHKVEKISATIAVVTAEGKTLVRRVPSGQRMAGLYEFPSASQLQEICSLTIVTIFDPVIHSFTRYRMTLYPAVYRAGYCFSYPGYQWVTLAHVEMIPFSAGHRKIWSQCREVAHENSSS